MLTNFKRNILSTLDFTAQFPGMRKPQEFSVYPMPSGSEFAKVQSDTRIGLIDMDTGPVALSKPHAGGAFNHHLSEARPVITLGGETLLTLKAHIAATSGSKVGTSFVHTDNRAAINVLGGAA